MTTVPRRRFLVLGFAYVLMAAFLAIGLGSINLPRLRALAARGVVVHGSVVRTDCSNHNRVLYSFSAHQQSYAGSGTDVQGSIPCEAIRPGTPVTVTYLPTDPSVNVAGVLQSHLANEWLSVALAALVFPAFAIGAVLFRTHLRRQSGRA